MSHNNEEINPLNLMPKDLERQSTGLDQTRETSSIPRNEQNKWEYPSEQQFFNAVVRKHGLEKANQAPAGVLVKIHNAVNERCWSEVLKWEALNSPGCVPKLVKFEGKPLQPSPKSRLWQLLGYRAPFDRHDWVVESCGRVTTYIIDFYGGGSDGRERISFFLDVRPRLRQGGWWLRLKYNLYEWFPRYSSLSFHDLPLAHSAWHTHTGIIQTSYRHHTGIIVWKYSVNGLVNHCEEAVIPSNQPM